MKYHHDATSALPDGVTASMMIIIISQYCNQVRGFVAHTVDIIIHYVRRSIVRYHWDTVLYIILS